MTMNRFMHAFLLGMALVFLQAAVVVNTAPESSVDARKWSLVVIVALGGALITWICTHRTSEESK